MMLWAPTAARSPPAPLLELLHRIEHMVAPALTAGRSVVRWGAHHTGLPVVVVAALTLVLAVRVARRTWHIALEFAFALGLLLAATRLGWLTW